MSDLLEKVAMQHYAKHCDCGDVGFYVVANEFTGEPEQQQCEFCYTQNSYFNIESIISMVLDEAIEAVKNERNQTAGSKTHAVKAIDKLK